MKQAILITVYKDISHIHKVVEAASDDFKFYVHVDKKSKISDEEIKDLSGHKRVFLVQKKYEVNWGGLIFQKRLYFF